MPPQKRKNAGKRGRKPGRPSLFTAKVIARLVKAARDGATRTEAATRCGIGYRTLADWLELGEGREAEGDIAAVAPDPQFAPFAMKYAQAEEAYFESLERVVNNGAKKDASIALSVLARRRPKKWAHKTQVRFGEGEGKQPVFTLHIGGTSGFDQEAEEE